jgi:hypothetical protein
MAYLYLLFADEFENNVHRDLENRGQGEFDKNYHI